MKPVVAIHEVGDPCMVKKLMRPRGSRISAVHPVFRASEWGWCPSPLSSHAASVIHCLFPDDCVPDDHGCHTL